ncbi:5-(carboxyamino)imidazole ribonucleotide synthase [Methylovirgula sp. HY1]|uniref:5-(carboxyamino)imidazole ribonucleotide synthase n=1 Tax=Methylovirgula sp. HY1 TaxID=2822761 RepID=UPI001C5A705B|nr:5-(carboxyamino)imidazole ribonucleotide synthase [Methylovirgula sp. HY1]QXX76018.1 N5-carboxyaminoimidazole ribonucleotide synthase [Methylovirgula sp. HY1]
MPPALTRRLEPGDTIGILGGGQLGRMLSMAAARLGLKAHIFSPDKESPAFDVASSHTIADFDDEAALAHFADQVDVVTYEFENVPARTAAVLAEHGPVRPGPAALAACQDRLVEKEFLSSLGIKTAIYAGVDDAGALARAVAQIGRPAILKTRRFGYDGKGQLLIREGSDLATGFRSLGGVPSILEGVVAFSKEVSVVAARGTDGSFTAYDVCENIHVNHILSVSRAPAHITPDCAAEAVACTQRIADALDYVGVIAVELFVTEETRPGTPMRQTIRVNEIAPRVHNSGHWTLDGAVTSQFEQHIRAIAGWPLGATDRHGASVEMRNLIGDDVRAWPEILAEPGACLHLYGKTEARPGRKMGHVTRIIPRET